jgi:Peptidase C13 family
MGMMGRARWSALLVAGLLVVEGVAPVVYAGTHWKAILLAGDNSAPVFDNATHEMARLLERRGVEIVATFSADPAKVSETVRLATHEALRSLPGRVTLSRGEGCLFFATSHGTRQGLRLPSDPVMSILSPSTLKKIIDETCGAAPTVLVISACHSGTFIRRETLGPNLVILTAASERRKSFGCRPERRFTYYDGCVLAELPKGGTWEALHIRLRACIEQKEASSKEPASDPQAYFGRDVKDLPLPKTE